MSAMRGRRRANYVLAISFVAFIGATGLRYVYGDVFWAELLWHATQAALIGGLADWFAVTALFEKPLGIPWHTALIPRNRVKMIDALARTVETDFLGPAMLKARLAEVNIAGAVIGWLDRQANRQMITDYLAVQARQYFRSVDCVQVSEKITELLREALMHTEPTSHVRRLAVHVMRRRKDEQLINLLMEELAVAVSADRTRQLILGHLREKQQDAEENLLARLAIWIGEQTDSVNMEDLAAALQRDMAALLIAMRSAEHPARRWLRLQLIVFVRRMGKTADAERVLALWLAQLAERLPLYEPIERLVQGVLKSNPDEKGLYRSPLLLWLLSQVQKRWEEFKANPEEVEWLNGHLRRAAERVIESEHSFIGKVVRDALTAFSDRDISLFVEDKVGDDLAWIRINGSIVGAAAGTVLFLFMKFVYERFM